MVKKISFHLKFAKITDLAQSSLSRISEYRHFLPHNIRVVSFQQQQKQLVYIESSLPKCSTCIFTQSNNSGR